MTNINSKKKKNSENNIFSQFHKFGFHGMVYQSVNILQLKCDVYLN